jgi:hypothetical protein
VRFLDKSVTPNLTEGAAKMQVMFSPRGSWLMRKFGKYFVWFIIFKSKGRHVLKLECYWLYYNEGHVSNKKYLCPVQEEGESLEELSISLQVVEDHGVVVGYPIQRLFGVEGHDGVQDRWVHRGVGQLRGEG